MNSSLLLSLTVHCHQNLLAASSSLLRHRDDLPLVLKRLVGNVAEFRERSSALVGGGSIARSNSVLLDLEAPRKELVPDGLRDHHLPDLPYVR